MSVVKELLPGEDPSVRDPVEVEHWITLYEERRSIWQRRLRRAASPQERVALERYLEWLRDRLAFWRDRHTALSGIQLDPSRRSVTGHRGTVPLTRREFQLLSFLADHPGRHFPAALLVMRAWPDADLCEEQLRTYLVRLRRKLDEAGVACRILAERPRGYVLVIDQHEGEAVPGT